MKTVYPRISQIKRLSMSRYLRVLLRCYAFEEQDAVILREIADCLASVDYE